jgi:uncharacterized YigZ family protein
MIDEFRTIEAQASGRITRKRSRFLAFLEPVGSAPQAAAFQEAVRSIYHDATHVCSAYRVLTREGVAAACDDDGEPHGSAGQPILQQIEKADLLNVTAAVVRYYGGVNLGVGGLVRAYSAAVADALTGAHIVTRAIETTLIVSFPAAAHGGVMAAIHRSKARVQRIEYDERAHVRLSLPPSRVEEFTAVLVTVTSGQAAVEVVE